MPDDDQSGRQWIVEPPPAAGEIALYFATGEGMDLTAEQEAALSALLRSLETDDPEVTGHDAPRCTDFSFCFPLKCGSVSCGNLTCGLLTKSAARGAGGWNLAGSFSTRATG
jgi:hypothetical protein